VPGNKNYAETSSNRGKGTMKKKFKNLNFLFEIFIPIDYIFVYLGSFDSFHLDLL